MVALCPYFLAEIVLDIAISSDYSDHPAEQDQKNESDMTTKPVRLEGKPAW